MTLLEIITRHESAQPDQSAPIALTPRGRAQVAGSRFARALRELDAQERAEALALFAPQLRSVIAELATGA